MIKTINKIVNKLRNRNSIWKFNREIERYDIDNMPLFSEISIETVNRCNGKCKFCPVNAMEPQREYAKMPEALFRKIISELKEVKYNGTICFSLNNEPFLDERIYEFILWARTQLPDAYFSIWTNGSIFDECKFITILPAMNKVYIDQYSKTGSLSAIVENLLNNPSIVEGKDYKIYDGLELDGIGDEKISIFVRRDDDILSSRGGYAPNKKNIKKTCRKKCIRFFCDICIRPDGKVSLCCSDALGKMTMGDTSVENVISIWENSAKFREVREKMIKSGRKSIELCKYCDFEG